MFPTAAEYHADPRRRHGAVPRRPAGPKENWFGGHPTGPASDRSNTSGGAEFPFPGARLNRLCTHPAIVDFIERGARRRPTSGSTKRRSAPSTPARPTTNSPCTPTATTRGCRARRKRRGGTSRRSCTSPTSTTATRRRTSSRWTRRSYVDRRRRSSRPTSDPDVYGASDRRQACAAHSSRTAPTCSTVVSTSPSPRRPAFLLNVSYKVAGHDWIGFTAIQSRATARTGWSSSERIDTTRARPPRLPAARPPDLDRRAPRPHRRALPEARSHPVAESTR